LGAARQATSAPPVHAKEAIVGGTASNGAPARYSGVAMCAVAAIRFATGQGYSGEDAMSDEELKEMAQKYIEAINNDDFDLLAEIVAVDFKDQAQVAGMASGLEGAKQAHVMLRSAFPDVHFTLDDVVVEGDQLVMRATGSGTHKGDFFGIPATGQSVKWTGSRILRAANGKFVEGVNEFDQVGILQQLGVVPPFTPGGAAESDPAANKAIVQRLYDEENKGNLDAIDELMSPTFVMHGDALAPITVGSDSVKESVRMVRTAFPDLVVSIENMVAAGDKVATRLRWRGTWTGGFMGLTPHGKEMTWTAIAVNRLDNGKIVERWFNSDVFGMLQQFGLIPPMG
jgi:predicted ester cyclase